MIEDVRAALLGDHEAAKRLTEAGVLLPCPMCADTPYITNEFYSGYFWYKCSCGVKLEHVKQSAKRCYYGTPARRF